MSRAPSSAPNPTSSALERDILSFAWHSRLSEIAAIAAAPLAALDLPLRVVVWEDRYQTKVSYPSPAEVARRYGFDGDLAVALESIDVVISAVVDRERQLPSKILDAPVRIVEVARSEPLVGCLT